MARQRRRLYVCESCIEDEELQAVVRANLISNKCDYCQTANDALMASGIDSVIQRMRYAVNEVFTDPASELPYDGREGGYQGSIIDDSYDLFEQMNFCVENAQLLDDLMDEFNGEVLCYRDVFGPSSEEFFEDAWERFKRVVQHQRRYTFWESQEDGEHGDPARNVSASEMLPEIGHNIEHVSPILDLPVGEEFWRVQVFERGMSSTNPARYTSPPTDHANQPNRMSPAGISMFYGANDFDTAVAETVDPSTMGGQEATGARFQTLVALNVLDLSNFYGRRSFFVELDRRGRNAVEFLTAFNRELSRPIQQDGRQHIEYVPTQVFTEYVRFRMTMQDEQPIHGIKYRSSRNGQACFVIFADQSDCLSNVPERLRPQLLDFIDGSLRTEIIESSPNASPL
ncbi:HEPN-associated N-terminal domain-containing protein [Gimesia algae]|uniref:RES domain protein n=1 Tax=Gimesia algae TaxID=2527971 RepID=A0A517VFI2_9PLAN|nr:HEPN-associated N-terminal domain-containing protein [Gimesia algae]QDT91749.1 RES domain protein [Gimesia algae]